MTRMSVHERLTSRVDTTAECWLWVGANVRGYGQIKIAGKVMLAHRVMWEMVNGPIPEGMVVMHTCDTPSCIRPDHLRLGTQSENITDMVDKGRENPWARSVTACKRGHEFTEANTYLYRGKRGCRACRRGAVRRYDRG